MKRIRYILLFTVLSASLFSISCSDDDSGDSNGTTTGDYWPMAVGNEWVYDAEGIIQTTKLTGTDVFGGTTYYRLEGLTDGGFLEGLESSTWCTKKGAAYYQKIGDVSLNSDGIEITITGFELPVLKDNLAEGGTWNGTLSSKVTYSYLGETESVTMTIKYTGTILDKVASVELNGTVYTDVIKSSLKQIISAPGFGETVSITETWYANNIGPIKTETIIDGESTGAGILIDYTLF